MQSPFAVCRRSFSVFVCVLICMAVAGRHAAASSGNVDIGTTLAQLAARTSTVTLSYEPNLTFPEGVTLLLGGSRGSKIEPCGCRGLNLGGIDREAAMIESIRAVNPTTLMLESGGFFLQASDPDLRLQTYYFLEAAKPMGYDVINIGYRDLGTGIDFLRRIEAELGLPFVSANIVDANTSQPVFPSHKILEVKRRDGNVLKVGVIGVTAPNANASHPPELLNRPIASPAAWKWMIPDLRFPDKAIEMGGQAAPPASGGDSAALRFALADQSSVPTGTPYRVVDEIEAARTVAESIRGECDILVLLSFAGPHRTREIVEAVPLFDAAVSGDFLKRYEPFQAGPMNTQVVCMDHDGKYLGEIELSLNAQGQVTEKTGDLLPILVSYVVKPEISRYIAAYERDKGKLPAPKETVSVSERGFVGWRQCASCHTKETAQWKSTRHASAMKSLVGKGMQNNPDCLRCHVVAYRQPGGFTHLTVTGSLANVQCESCHGAGKKHVDEQRKKTALAAAEQDFKPTAKMKMSFDQAFCIQCHDQQNDPDFNFDRDMQRVKH